MTVPDHFHLEHINRHTYTYGILEGIGVCIGVPAKRGHTAQTVKQPYDNSLDMEFEASSSMRLEKQS